MSIERKKINEIVNLTKHEIVLGNLIIPPSGKYIRLKKNKDLVEVLEYQDDDIEVYQYQFMLIDPLPPKKDGRVYITAHTVAELSKRDDIYGLNEKIRGDDGKVIAAVSLWTPMPTKMM